MFFRLFCVLVLFFVSHELCVDVRLLGDADIIVKFEIQGKFGTTFGLRFAPVRSFLQTIVIPHLLFIIHCLLWDCLWPFHITSF